MFVPDLHLHGHVVPFTQYPVSHLVSVLTLAVTLPFIITSEGSLRGGMALLGWRDPTEDYRFEGTLQPQAHVQHHARFRALNSH